MSVSLLIELGTEDLPARYVASLADALGEGIAGGLAKAGIALGAHKTFATPRRIAVSIEGVGLQQPERTVERQGPALASAVKDGKPTPAALGFAKSCGVEFSELGEKDGKLYFAKTAPGKPTAELLPDLFARTLKEMDELVPKRMRWGEGAETFVRPVQWIVAIFNNQIVPLRHFGVDSGNVTYGHRFHAPASIELRNAQDYETALKKAFILADIKERKALIRHQIDAEAGKLQGVARITDDLLNEVTALVEWPVAISGRMEERFLQLPPEVIVATVETNQRYFTVFDAQGRLIPAFIAISNIESRDVSQVIVGNERVVRPRLTDAMFFWEQDLKQPLEAYGSRLAGITFQKDLGTIAGKVARLGRLAEHIARSSNERLPPNARVDSKAAARAAALSKNDLVTKMVFEFPELQGLMGGYYAEKSGEPADVAAAIREHYLPTQQGTAIPATAAGRIVALADKLDTLAGIFAIGQKPTASKDPFALRRAALGVLRICIEGNLPLDLRELIAQALDGVRADVQKAARDAGKPAAGADASKAGGSLDVSQAANRGAGPGTNAGATKSNAAGPSSSAVADEVLQFVLERLRAYYMDQQLPPEMFEAVKSLGIAAPLDFDARVQALRGFWALPAAKNLAAAHKRVRNILKQAGEAGAGAIDAKLFEHDAEKALSAKLEELRQTNLKLETRATGDVQASYLAKLENLAGLREPVDAFFEKVRVNADDAAVRDNRLALLHRLDAACREVADISCLPG